ncbi:MAG: hypothetical protein O3C40_03010 [Planctomycetota bacterium]|nr:hypothetical protein [Planctomycetota bacterium]
MNPTIETWQTNPMEVGPIYPLAGWEVPMFLACLVFCVAFMIWKFALETSQYTAKAAQLRQPGELAAVLIEHETRDQKT